MKNVSVILCFLFVTGIAIGQEKKRPKVLLVGTMHQVPKIVKNSYKHLLKKAIKYGPDAIYVERQRPEDSISLKNYESKWFIPYGDSLAGIFEPNPSRLQKLQKMSIHHMTVDDYKFLKFYYAVNRDKANWHYYGVLSRYGKGGSSKPLRNENSDLTLKLAIEMDINFIHSMDHQHETKEYYNLSKECYRASREDGQIKILNKKTKRDYRRAIIPALVGRLGHYTNKGRTLKSYHHTNRFDFRETPDEACSKGAAVWDRRNAGMAHNTGSQILSNNHKNAIVIVGAGHIIGLKEALEKQFPQISVETIQELE